MEEKSNSFTPQESLEIIGRFILNYKRNFRENSFFFLLWGWVISLASISHFIILRTLLMHQDYEKIGPLTAMNWIAFPAAGMIIQVIYLKGRNPRRETTRSHIDRFITTLWQVTAIAIIMELVFCIMIKHNYPSPFILTVVGLSTLVTGITIKFRPVIIGGILFFAFAIAASFFNNEYQLLINAAAIIVGYLVPGYMLRASKTE